MNLPVFVLNFTRILEETTTKRKLVLKKKFLKRKRKKKEEEKNVFKSLRKRNQQEIFL